MNMKQEKLFETIHFGILDTYGHRKLVGPYEKLNALFCSMYLLTVWMQELNAPLASLLMIPNWEGLLTLLRDKRPCRGI